jgi:hypothetical protein
MKPARAFLRSTSLVTAGLGLWLMSLEASLVMRYTGNPFTTVHGTLAAAHHMEAVAEFMNSGDMHPTAIQARVLSASGDVLLTVESSGPVGTPLWTGVFVWNADQITQWAWKVSTTGAYPEDYMMSDNFKDINNLVNIQDQAMDDYDGTGNYPGLAEVRSAGTWTAVPESGGYALTTALGLTVIALFRWRSRRG